MRYSLIVLLALVTGLAQAADKYQELRQRLGAAFPGAMITSIEETAMPSLLQVELNGIERLYASRDGEYILSGDMFQTRKEGGVVNLSEKKLAGVREQGLKSVKPSDMITYKAKDEKAEVFVFTDTSCGYCQRLHEQMSGYNSKGITVHYLAFPRGGMATEAGQTMRAVWCEKDRNAALTHAKLDGVTAKPKAGCKDPVEEQYMLGNRFGVRGTPAIFTATGDQIGGYLSPADMGKALGLK